MKTALLAGLACFLTVSLRPIHAQGAAGTTVKTEAQTPLTVCEVLENLRRHDGKMTAVIGRLSSNPFDGAWLSENGCGDKVVRGHPNWPYAIFLGCSDQVKPQAFAGKLNIDPEELEIKLARLRKTTNLAYYSPFVVARRPGEEVKKVQLRETWRVVYGRVQAATAAGRGSFGAVRAQAQLCAGEGAWVDIPEPDSPQRPQ